MKTVDCNKDFVLFFIINVFGILWILTSAIWKLFSSDFIILSLRDLVPLDSYFCNDIFWKK
jgi:hypothetical protein